MKITTVGIDFAKNEFRVGGNDKRGTALLRKQLRPSDPLLTSSAEFK